MFNTSLFDESTFYSEFGKDLLHARREVVIESPFITINRVNKLIPVFNGLIKQGVKVFVITRQPNLHDYPMSQQSEEVIRYFEEIGVQVLMTRNNHHRKLAIIDRNILWEGSLNILSQCNSREIMRRTEGDNHAQIMFDFLQLDRFIE